MLPPTLFPASAMREPSTPIRAPLRAIQRTVAYISSSACGYFASGEGV
jgi:hypothetical protein